MQLKNIFRFKIIKTVLNTCTLQLRVYKSKSKGRLETVTITHAAFSSKTIQHLAKLMNYRQHQLDSATTFTFKLYITFPLQSTCITK